MIMGNRWNIGRWRVDFTEGWLSRRPVPLAKRVRPDARLIAVLKVLTDSAGRTVSTEHILKAAWPDRVVSRDSVTTAIYQLRQLLGDDVESPRYIVSEPRRGYRLIAKTAPVGGELPTRLAAGVAVVLASGAFAATAMWPEPKVEPHLYVMPMQNYEESPVQGPLFSAIESTLLSELIQTVPGKVRVNDGEDVALHLESMMVACDLGPTLVMRLLDTEAQTYIWSEAYNLDEIGAAAERPSLVELVAMDVGAAIR